MADEGGQYLHSFASYSINNVPQKIVHKKFVYEFSGSVAYFAVALGYALVRPTV